MQVFHNVTEWRQMRATFPTQLHVGLVPTMGNLHAGHASLVDLSRQENDLTLVSIFINPTQFNQTTDFTNYPRTLEADLALLTNLGVDYCLLPDANIMYQDDFRYQMHEQQLAQLMEGRHRPGHFTGVLTVVLKLLNLAKPHRAYFGEKDFQQLQLIREMVAAFFMDVEIKACPTIRETSGLAFSSRNSRLNNEQLEQAHTFARIFHQSIALPDILKALNEAGITIEYLEEHQNRRFIAVKIGDVRLIDNYFLLTR